MSDSLALRQSEIFQTPSPWKRLLIISVCCLHSENELPSYDSLEEKVGDAFRASSSHLQNQTVSCCFSSRVKAAGCFYDSLKAEMFSGFHQKSSLFLLDVILVSPVSQQKHLEVERTAKWLKMLKSWEKYKNSEKVVLRRVWSGSAGPSTRTTKFWSQ